jgi:hypothetical protein
MDSKGLFRQTCVAYQNTLMKYITCFNPLETNAIRVYSLSLA